MTRTTRNTRTKSNMDEEGWTTMTPERRKPKNKTMTAPAESIISTIEGDIGKIEAGRQNKISVMSPGRDFKCNILETIKTGICKEFNPTILTINRNTVTKNSKAKKQILIIVRQRTVTTITIEILTEVKKI
jgi:hypothetical protein